jgi:iron(III) transport system substrate-binding protein
MSGTTLVKIAVALAFVLTLGTPFVFRPSEATPPPGAERLIIITPHNEQIRSEFGSAFSRWHEREHGVPVVIEWVRPGGTSEIRKQLTSVYRNAIAVGAITPEGELRDPGSPMPYDLLFGGGSYELGKMKEGVTARPGGLGEPIRMSMSVPGPFGDERLETWFGENRIGAERLYDPERHWLGTALSGFGIVYNRDALERLGVPEPSGWRDLADPRLTGWLAMVDPRMSGSVATLYDSILSNMGWEPGWRTLREMAANAQYFSNDSKKAPLDVSQGEAAVGVAIDFYGRYQAQAVMRPGETAATSRVGYVDPPGMTLIDPDPIAMMRGGPNPVVAARFIEFVLADEGQALWQFPVDHDSELGPRRFELRRMPIRRAFIGEHRERFVDPVDPFEIASETGSRGWRAAIGPLFGAFAVDLHHELTHAWRALVDARRRADEGAFDPGTLEEMERLFYSLPDHELADGRVVPFDAERLPAIRADWRLPGRTARSRIAYIEWFRSAYRRVVELAGA